MGGWPVIAGPLGAANNRLLNRNSGKCADVWSLSTADGAAVNSGNCNSGANQQWVPTAVGSNYRLVNVNSGKCLQIAGASTADGAVAVQSTCTGASNQLWTKTPVIGGYVTFTASTAVSASRSPGPPPPMARPWTSRPAAPARTTSGWLSDGSGER